MRESAGVWVLPAHTVPSGRGACEGECWGVGSGDLPAHTVPSGRVLTYRG